MIPFISLDGAETNVLWHTQLHCKCFSLMPFGKCVHNHFYYNLKNFVYTFVYLLYEGLMED